MRKALIRFGLFSAALLTSVLGSSSTSSASIALPSAVCVKGGAAGTAVWDWTGLFNSHTTDAMAADCSMPSDHSFPKGVSLAVYDVDSTRNITCYYQIIVGMGVVYDDGSQATSGAPGHASLTWIGTGGTVAGSVYVGCSIPRHNTAVSQSGIGTLGVAF
jgi:hypothetical protein